LLGLLDAGRVSPYDEPANGKALLGESVRERLLGELLGASVREPLGKKSLKVLFPMSHGPVPKLWENHC
jgi:hypothetical protein